MLYVEEALPVIEVALGAEHHATARARQLLSALGVHATTESAPDANRGKPILKANQRRAQTQAQPPGDGSWP